jgi:hypothetical protein
MATASNVKLPSSAVKAAANDVAQEDREGPAKTAGGFKSLVIALIVLNVAAAGGYAWLRFGWNGKLAKSNEMSLSQLSRLKTDLVNLDEAVRRIQRDQVQQVQDPGTLLSTVATTAGLSDALRTDKPLESKFGRTNYTETTVRFSFTGRASYEFKGMLKFFTDVEKANPTVQIREINFGDRTQEKGVNMWEVKQGVVRVLKPQKTG